MRPLLAYRHHMPNNSIPLAGTVLSTIIEYIAAMKTEVNLADHYRKDLIEVLCRFTKHNNNRPFKDLERIDILSFLDSFRKTETKDPLHKWIGTVQYLQNAFI